jgi:hypothetical protein
MTVACSPLPLGEGLGVQLTSRSLSHGSYIAVATAGIPVDRVWILDQPGTVGETHKISGAGGSFVVIRYPATKRTLGESFRIGSKSL